MEKEIVGRRYGHLTQITNSFRNGRRDYPKALFMCECGNVIAVNKSVVLKHHLFDRCRVCKKEMEEKLNSNNK